MRVGALGALVLASIVVGACAHVRPHLSGVAALVDGDPVLAVEVDRASAPYVAAGGSPVEDVRSAVLERLIEQRLIEHAAVAAGIVVGDAEVDAAIANVPGPMPSSGDTPEVRADIRSQLLVFRVLNATMGSRVVVTEAQTREHYDQLVQQARRADASADVPTYDSVRLTIAAQMRQEALADLESVMRAELRAAATIERTLDE